jgi:hypothetical protein
MHPSVVILSPPIMVMSPAGKVDYALLISALHVIPAPR